MTRSGLSVLVALCAGLLACTDAIALESREHSCQILQPLLQKQDEASGVDDPSQLCFDVGPDTGRLLRKGGEYCVRPKDQSCTSLNGRVVTFLVEAGGEMSDGLAVCDLSSQACKVWTGFRNGEFLGLIANDAGKQFVLVLVRSLRHGIVDTSILAVPIGIEIPQEPLPRISLADTTYAYSESGGLCGDSDAVFRHQPSVDGIKPTKGGSDVALIKIDDQGGKDVVLLRYSYENCRSHKKFRRTRRLMLTGDRVVELLSSDAKLTSRRVAYK